MATRLSDAIFWIAVAASAIAQLFIVRAVFRVTPGVDGSSSGTKGTGEHAANLTHPRQTVAARAGVPAPHRLTEIVWVVLPVLLLTLAFFGAWRTMHPGAASSASGAGAAIGTNR